jgi:hypothetical protein
MTIFKNLKTPKYFLVALGTAFIVFDILFVLMASLPGTQNEMCVMGGNLTAGNIFYSIFFSILVGIVIAGFLALADKNIKTRKMTMGSISGVGAGLGFLTAFCTVCTIPVISFLGLSISLEFFTYNNLFVKIISVCLIAYAIFRLNKQLEGQCDVCVDTVQQKNA